jgi:hypothetical protein
VAFLRFGTLGNGFAFGESQFTNTNNLSPVLQSNISPGVMRSQYGWGQRSSRVWGRSYQYTPAAVSQADVGDLTITISSTSGAILGRIRTDIEKPVLHSIEFTNDENGCADFVLRLARLPEFEILPFAIVDVNISNTSFNWFSGVITYVDEAGTRGGAFADPEKNSPYEYRGFGLRQYIDDLRADVDFASLQDVGIVVKDILRDYVVGVDETTPFSPVRYNESKIETVTDTVLANTIELGKFSLRQVLDTLGQMASGRWGVDGDGETYFEQKTTNIKRTFAIGYRVNDFRPTLSYDNIKNAIIVQRQQGRGSGGSGWAVAGLYNDATSVKTYGRKELLYQIPGYFSDSDADIIGNSLLDSLAEPMLTADVTGIQILAATDYFERGYYRFIMPLAEYRENVAAVENASEFTVVGAGDLAVTTDSTFGNYIFGVAGVKFNFNAAANQRAETTISALGIIKEIRFYVKSSKTGALVRVGVGANQYDEHLVNVDVQVRDEFRPFVWDVSELNLTTLRVFGVEVIADVGESVNLWIDKIDVIYRGHQAYTMELKRVTYSFSPSGSIAKAEFGDLPKALSDYVSGLLASSSELRFTGEIR